MMNTNSTELVRPASPRMSRFLILEALVFLLPSSVSYVVIAILSSDAAGLSLEKLSFALGIGLTGFAQFSVWWLVLSHTDYGSLKAIPKWLWGGLISGALIVLSIILLIAFSSPSEPMTLPIILATFAIIAILVAVCALPFWVSKKSFPWARGLLWLVLVLPILLLNIGAGEPFVGAALTLILLALFIGPLILSAILLATIRHNASGMLEQTALSES
jgi:hypothetical protein